MQVKGQMFKKKSIRQFILLRTTLFILISSVISSNKELEIHTHTHARTHTQMIPSNINGNRENIFSVKYFKDVSMFIYVPLHA